MLIFSSRVTKNGLDEKQVHQKDSSGQAVFEQNKRGEAEVVLIIWRLSTVVNPTASSYKTLLGSSMFKNVMDDG